ncbi:MAG: prepilin-type N-terminal cleavage/methylation domain-containing protein [Elusimicrobiaceae bacterium]|nr:prepilin-type N-terminal cleavage/methylation domain-containing protein [Elusimicrobiaceae bacterium]
MKKGFTLIELLIIMVIVGILVTVAFPKFKTAMEKGRSLEGIHNANAVSEAANAVYVKNGFSYGSNASEFKRLSGITNSQHFNSPDVTIANEIVTVTLLRKTNKYSIVYTCSGGEITSRMCKGDKKICNAIGALSGSGSNWNF